MVEGVGRWRLNVRGSIQLTDPSGKSVRMASKRGVAIVVMLAISPNGTRNRGWLQERLWTGRDLMQIQGSLRRELTALRAILNKDDALLTADSNRVTLDPEKILVQFESGANDGFGHADLFEGLEIVGVPKFNVWLEDARQSNSTRVNSPTLSVVSNVAKPATILVMSLVNQTSKPSIDYQCEGISEDLIIGLSRWRWLKVIGRSAWIGAQEKWVSGLDQARNVGADYLLQGAVREGRNGLEVSTWLSDTRDGVHLFHSNVNVGQSLGGAKSAHIASEISGGLSSTIDLQEQQRTFGQSQADQSVSDLIWRGRYHLNRLSKEDLAKAIEFFEAALKKQPLSSEAIIQLTTAKQIKLWTRRASYAEISEVRQLAQAAILAARDDARPYSLAAVLEFWMRDYQRAEYLFEEALSLNSSDFLTHSNYAAYLNAINEPQRAMLHAKIALSLGPLDPQRFFNLGELAVSEFLLKNYAEAKNWAEKSIGLRPNYWYARVILVNALAALRDPRVSHEADILNHRPSGFSSSLLDWLPYKDPEFVASLKKGLLQT